MWVFYSGSGVIKGSGSSGVCAGRGQITETQFLRMTETDKSDAIRGLLHL